jgi:hypothetical protein
MWNIWHEHLNIWHTKFSWMWGSWIGIATILQARWWRTGVNSQQRQDIFLFCIVSQLDLWPAHTHIQCVLVAFSPGVKTAGAWSQSLTTIQCQGRAIQWNLDSSFPLGVLKKNDGYGKTIDAGAYIKWIKTVTFAYVYLLTQKMYTNDTQKLNDGSGKAIHLGTIDRGFTVLPSPIRTYGKVPD